MTLGNNGKPQQHGKGKGKDNKGGKQDKGKGAGGTKGKGKGKPYGAAAASVERKGVKGKGSFAARNSRGKTNW